LPIDSFGCECIRRMIFNSPMWITPLHAPRAALDAGSRGSVLSPDYPPIGKLSG